MAFNPKLLYLVRLRMIKKISSQMKIIPERIVSMIK